MCLMLAFGLLPMNALKMSLREAGLQTAEELKSSQHGSV